MSESIRFSEAKKLLLISPYFLLVFLVIPLYSVLGIKLNLPVSGTLLLGNNVLFCICVLVRFFRCVLKIRGGIRYGSDCCQPKSVLELSRPASQLQIELVGAGYIFDSVGRYGEKRDLGYVGTTLLYGALLLLLLFGSYDYMREYSVMVRLGVGEPMSLARTGLVGQIEAGALADTNSLPLLQVRKQILPNEQWPKGATEIALLSKDRKELAKGTVAPGKPFRHDGLDYHMTKFLFDALIGIRKEKSVVYDSFVKFLPLQQKKDAYSYAASLRNNQFPDVNGTAWLIPEKKAMRVEVKLGANKSIDFDLELWGTNKVTQGEYVASFEGLAHWSEIRVARGRHRAVLMIGAVLAVFGGLIRIAIRPQRVWLEEAEEGSRVRAIGGKTLRLLMKDETKSSD